MESEGEKLEPKTAKDFLELYYCDFSIQYDIPYNGKDLNSEPEPFIQIHFKCVRKSDNVEIHNIPIRWTLKGVVPTNKGKNGISELSEEDKKNLFTAKYDFIMSWLKKTNKSDIALLDKDNVENEEIEKYFINQEQFK